MRRVLTGATLAMGVIWSATALAAPKPDKSLLGVRILDTWKAVLAKYGQPTRVEAGPPAELSVTPTTTVGGTAMFSPGGTGMPFGMAGMTGARGLPSIGGISGPPTTPMMGGMSSAGGAAGAPRSPMMGGMSSMMMGPPRGAMGGMSSAGGRGLPGLGGMGMAGGMSAPMGAMGDTGSGIPMPGLRGGTTAPGMPGGMMGAPMLGGMPGAPGGATGTMTQTSAGTAIETGPGEVAWVYEKGTDTHVFLFNNEGRVIQIQSFGYKAGARTVNGVGLGDTAAKVYSIYGFPEETIVSGNTRTLDYSKKANVAFQLADRGKGMRVVGITVALTVPPNPEKPE